MEPWPNGPARYPEPPEADAEKTTLIAPIKLESHESWLPSEHPLHRPRHGRRQYTALLYALVFFCVPVVTLIMGAKPAEFENRRLAAFPSPLDGWGFFTGMSGWATDHLPLRDVAIRAADDISRGLFGEPPPVVGPPDIRQAPPFAPPQPRDDDQRPDDQREPPVAAGFVRVLEGKDDWLYFGFDVQAKCEPEMPPDEVIGNLVELRQAVEASGREFVLVVPPDKSTMVPDYMPSNYFGKRCAADASETFWRDVTTKAGAIDLRNDLRQIEESDGSPPYYRLDTHWDDRGAIAMVLRVAEAIEPGVSRTWDAEPKRTSAFQADLPTMLGRQGKATVQMYSLAPDGLRDRTRNSLDLREMVRLKSTPGQGMVREQVGMLTDSFSVAASRYLPAAFADIDVVYYSTLEAGHDEAVDMLVEQDVIVFEVVERNLTSGIANVLDPAFIDQLATSLAAHPR